MNKLIEKQSSFDRQMLFFNERSARALGLRCCWRQFFIHKEDDAYVRRDMDEVSGKTFVKSPQSLIPIDGFLVRVQVNQFSKMYYSFLCL